MSQKAFGAALGDMGALAAADTGLAEGGRHILLWLDALTIETANDWGDGLRTLTLGATAAPTEEIALLPLAAQRDGELEIDPGDGPPVAIAPE